MPATLTRAQFEHACRRYINTHSGARRSDVKTFPTGWSWREHPHVPGLGYLLRTVYLPQTQGAEVDHEPDVLEHDMMEDESTAQPPQELLTCKQYVVYSPTFEVPAFYFTLHESSGSPLILDQIVRSVLFRHDALPSSNGNTFGLLMPDSSLALLSQGDHPTLGTPSWYLHPCHTSEVVGEIIAEGDGEGSEDELLRSMEVWFMVLGNIVDFFAGCE
ncbi:hypothetical protein C2E23DRAFT_728021 [Lenzites betulinus]|nr:hypothetical protein C2E23DRAFT_728021 [Lenzites betulinus]